MNIFRHLASTSLVVLLVSSSASLIEADEQQQGDNLGSSSQQPCQTEYNHLQGKNCYSQSELDDCVNCLDMTVDTVAANPQVTDCTEAESQECTLIHGDCTSGSTCQLTVPWIVNQCGPLINDYVTCMFNYEKTEAVPHWDACDTFDCLGIVGSANPTTSSACSPAILVLSIMTSVVSFVLWN